MDCVFQTPPPTVASSTWTRPEYSRRVGRAVKLFVWPELAASVQSLCPCSSALSRWRRGVAAPLLATNFWVGGWGSGAYRRPPDPPAPSDPQAFTDTRPSSVSPVRSPWVRVCGPATCTWTKPAGVLQLWFKRWTGSWGEWNQDLQPSCAPGEEGCVSGHVIFPGGQNQGRWLGYFPFLH